MANSFSPKALALLGSTGSIGTQALDVVREQARPVSGGGAHGRAAVAGASGAGAGV
ncbi:MAG: hypothetical protein WKG07_04195 [Hymenobacter sp.]